MKKQTKVLLIAGAAVIAGLIIAVAGFYINGWQSFYMDETGIHNYDNMKRISEEITPGEFNSMQVSSASADIRLIESDSFRVTYNLSERFTVNDVSVINGTLQVDVQNRGYLTLFNFDFFNKAPKDEILIYYPSSTKFDTVDLYTSSGEINGKNLEAVTAKFKISSGNCNINGLTGTDMIASITSGEMRLADLTLDTLDANTSSGYIQLDQVSAKNNLQISTTSGYAKLTGIDAGDITVNVSSGDVRVEDCTAASLKGKITSGSFYGGQMKLNGVDYRISSGNVDLIGEFRGTNVLHTTSGNVRVENSLPETECSYRLSATSGSTRVNHNDSIGVIRDGAENTYDFSASSGNIDLNFVQ